MLCGDHVSRLGGRGEGACQGAVGEVRRDMHSVSLSSTSFEGTSLLSPKSGSHLLSRDGKIIHSLRL